MPVPVYNGANVSLGNGVTTVFPYDFKILDQTHIEVKVDGVLKVLGADFAVDGVGNSNGGNVTMTVAPANGLAVQRARKVPYTRAEDYQANGDFKEDTVDKDFDLREMQIQQVAADITRAFKAPLSVTADMVLTDAMWAARASMMIGFDGAGGLGVFAALNPANPASAYILTLLDDPDAPTARATLGALGTDFTLLAAEAAPAIDDLLALRDTSAGTTDKIRLDDLLKVVNGLTADVAPAPTADYVLEYDGSAGAAKKLLLADLPMMRFAISGLTYAMGDGAGGGDQVNDITIAIGACRDSTDAYNLRLAAAITKQLDANWAVGTNAGGLDNGAIANTDYFIWLIKRSDTGVVDALFSTSGTAPVMPASYDSKRLIGWIRRLAGAIVAFHTYEVEGGGLELSWDAPVLDVNIANTLTTSRRTDALSVPQTFSVTAIISPNATDAGAGPGIWIGNPDVTDGAASTSASPGITIAGATAVLAYGGLIHVRTSSAGVVASRATIATVDTYRIFTNGFLWPRRNT